MEDTLAGYAYEAGVACCVAPGACWAAAGHPDIMTTGELGGAKSVLRRAGFTMELVVFGLLERVPVTDADRWQHG